MAYSARILKDSLAWTPGSRLTTMEVTLPRIVLAEFNTHRVFSRNSASSRAIPVEKMIKRVQDDPFIPTYWGKNQKGMQAEQEVTPELALTSQREWLKARDNAVKQVESLLALGIHKQITNRLLEPFLWQTIIVTATEWDNFFALRCHPDAQPEIREAAVMMKNAYENSFPVEVKENDWHTPLVDDSKQLHEEGYTSTDIARISAGRCARVSYLTHDGKRDPKADIDLANRLQDGGHMSPFEHVARPMTIEDAQGIVLYSVEEFGSFPPRVDISSVFSGNFRGWVQFRKHLPFEHNFKKALDKRNSIVT